MWTSYDPFWLPIAQMQLPHASKGLGHIVEEPAETEFKHWLHLNLASSPFMQSQTGRPDSPSEERSVNVLQVKNILLTTLTFHQYWWNHLWFQHHHLFACKTWADKLIQSCHANHYSIMHGAGTGMYMCTLKRCWNLKLYITI